MKYLDTVKVIKDREEYQKEKVFLGDIGTIINPEIRDNQFYVVFENNDDYDWYRYCCVNIEDLELVKDHKASDSMIAQDLPKQDPRWWCKVENGYIMNLKGEKKNKTPYDYYS